VKQRDRADLKQGAECLKTRQWQIRRSCRDTQPLQTGLEDRGSLGLARPRRGVASPRARSEKRTRTEEEEEDRSWGRRLVGRGQARRPSCRRLVFRTTTRHLELCLSIRVGRRERTGYGEKDREGQCKGTEAEKGG